MYGVPWTVRNTTDGFSGDLRPTINFLALVYRASSSYLALSLALLAQLSTVAELAKLELPPPPLDLPQTEERQERCEPNREEVEAHTTSTLHYGHSILTDSANERTIRDKR